MCTLQAHGWPSFRDAEVVWDDVRVLPDGEAVSVAGTHLGHNLPDRKVGAREGSLRLATIHLRLLVQGNRYCINLVSVAAPPPS